MWLLTAMLDSMDLDLELQDLEAVPYLQSSYPLTPSRESS